MKAYKGFTKDMQCRDFQFETGKTYEEDSAELCKRGFHACLNPLDCWNYYDIIDSVFHEVELDGVSSERKKEDTKIVAKKITVGAKLDIAGMVKGAIDFVFSSVKEKKGNYAQLASSGNYAQLASSGDSAKLASSGNYAQLASSGYYAQLASSGYSAKLASSGDSAKLASSGYSAKLASSGDSAKLASSGDSAQLVSSGYSAKLDMQGSCSVGAAIGICSTIRGKLGCWITLAEYDEDRKPKCVKSAQIDGERLKPDTWYALQDGEFVALKG